MNGGADLGGMMGFGPVIEEPDEPLFHENWEERVLGITVALGACGLWNIDQSRYARESMQPAAYMSSSYYEVWFHGIMKLLQKHGMISLEELETGIPTLPLVPVNRTLMPDDVAAALKAGGPANRAESEPAQLRNGQTVRTINTHPATHTRLPRYARDKVGKITKIHGVHVFPDSSGQGLGEQPTWLYQVTFTAKSLWGETATNDDTVSLDLWQPHLRAV